MPPEAANGHGELAEALGPLGRAAAPAELVRAVSALLAGADEQDVRPRIRELEGGLRNLLHTVEGVRARLDALAERRAATPFDDAWWERRRRAAGGPQGPADWAGAYAQALRAGRYDVAQRLALPEEALVPAELAAAALSVSRALAEDRPGDWVVNLIPVVERSRELPVEPADRTDLEILLARGLLRTGRVAEARERLRRAAEDTVHAGDPVLRGRLTATLGECALAARDLASARAAFEEAVRLGGDEPAALVGLAMIEEEQHRWSAAQALYDRAVAAVEDPAGLGRLHAPTTGTLYWRLSRRLSSRPGREQEALRALDQALEQGIAGADPSSERRAHVDRGYLLERLGRPREAALAFAEGARRYSSGGKLETARALLERALDLDGTQALFRWSLADVLRQLAQRPDGSADPALIDAALWHWHAGFSRRPPARDEAWVHLSHALAQYDDVRHDPSERHRLWEAAASVERALLLDGMLADGWQLLSSLHGDLGHGCTALEAADRALAVGPSEEAAAYYRSRALLGLGRVTEAYAALPPGDDRWVCTQRAVVHVVRGEPQEALACLDLPGEPRPVERLVRALCLMGAGRDDDAVSELSTAPPPAEPMTRAGLHEAAWVAYLRGRHDLAEELLDRALAADPAEPADELLDQGQVLLARGAAADLVSGEQRLVDGVRACSRWDTLQLLTATELPFLLRRVAGLDHAGAVERITGRLRPLIDRRMAAIRENPPDLRSELRGVLAGEPSGRTPAAVAAPAALARAELGDSAGAALGRYLDLAPSVPEAWEGVVLAATRVRDRLDRGDTAESGPGWDSGYVRLLRAAEAVPAHSTAGGAAQAVRRGLAVRAAVSALLSGHRQEAAGVLAGEAPPSPEPDADFTAAVRAVVRGGDDYWTLTERVAELPAGGDTDTFLRSWAEQMLSATGLDVVYRTRREDVDMTAIFPLESPVVVSLGPGLVVADPGPDWVLFRRLVPQLRERIRARTGITIPGIRFRGDEAEAAGYRMSWDRRTVRRGTAGSLPRSDDDDAGLAEVIAELENLLVDNLDRLVGPDDLDLWVQEIDPTGEIGRRPPVARLLSDRESRLWTHRVLRLLLREGFPLVHGPQVLEVLAEAVAEGTGDPIDAADRVRATLPERVPGRDGVLRRLPGDLEERVAAGLRAGGTGVVWQSPWTEAAAAVRAVRAWQAAWPSDDLGPRGTIVVTDPGARHYLWRLLAPEGSRTTVVSAREVPESGTTARAE